LATTVGLNAVKEAIQTLLDSANTTTASPVDLSSGLAGGVRVRAVLKTHPEMIRPQASMFPLVTCYVQEKVVKDESIAGSQLRGKRRATAKIVVVGAVWNNNISSVDEDPADEDISNLMENIELTLRSDPSLGGAVNWQRPAGVKYFITALNQQTHLRSGLLSLDCEFFY
jgi:hypothetical protein